MQYQANNLLCSPSTVLNLLLYTQTFPSAIQIHIVIMAQEANY